MIKISKENVIKSFYFLMAVDGEIGDDEFNQFIEFGNAIDENFEDNRASIIEECREIVEDGQQDSDQLIFLIHTFEKKLNEQNDTEEKISARLMIWDLYIIAYSNGLLLDVEKEFIKVVSSFCQINESVLLEMEEICKTYFDIEREQQWIKNSNLKYSEAEMLLSEIETRKNTLLIAATNLIEDDIYSPDAAYIGKIEPGVMRDVLNAYDEAMDKISSAIEETYNDFLDTETGKKVAEFGEQVESTVQDTMKNIKDSDVGKAAAEFGEQAGKTLQDAGAQVADFFGGLFKK